jgi:hypothetical protein
MKLQTPAILPLVVSLSFLPAVGHAQAPSPASTSVSAPAPTQLSVDGHPGNAPVVQINGRSYVEVESLARIISGSLAFQPNSITLVLPLSAPSPATADTQPPPPPKPGFSKDFLRAGIEAMSVIREWRSAIVNAVQTGNPVTEEWVSNYRRTADAKVALAATAVSSDSDRQGLPLLQNEFSNMQKLSDSFLALNQSHSYTPTNSFDNNPLDDQILACARGLASLATSGGQFEDIPSCH